jgi:hypothetical protein
VNEFVDILKAYVFSVLQDSAIMRTSLHDPLALLLAERSLHLFDSRAMLSVLVGEIAMEFLDCFIHFKLLDSIWWCEESLSGAFMVCMLGGDKVTTLLSPRSAKLI